MRVITHAFAVPVVLFGGAVAVAGAAAAASPLLQGVYAYHEEGAPEGTTWTVTPTCSPTVGDLREPLYLPVGCTLHVTSATPAQVTFEERAANFGGDARLVAGRWQLVANKLEGTRCPDGGTRPSTDVYEFDNETLTGTRTVTQPGECGLLPSMEKRAFTLTFLRPLPRPVERYPFYCEPGGLRACW